MAMPASAPAAFDIARMRLDMARRGWRQRDLARAAGVSDATVTMFLSGRRQSPRVAAKLATAMGATPRRYLGR